MRIKLILFLISALTGFNQIAYAEDMATSAVREGIHATFTDLEKNIIKEYFSDHVSYVERDEDSKNPYDKSSKKKKKSKDKPLPPGIAKKLERGGTMPPGIAKQFLPDDLERELPKAPKGYEWTIVDNDVVLVDVDTGKIADIITDVLIGE